MKKLFLILCFFALIACGNQNYSTQQGGLGGAAAAAKAQRGLVLRVQNALPEEQAGARRIRPNLNAFFCSPVSLNQERILSFKERCVRLVGEIPNGTEQVFFISPEDLAAVYRRGQGRASFEFADDQQLTSNPWSCYSPNDQVTLDADLNSKQTWTVIVNQRFSLTYGCLINR